jgi:hypothetical protein
MGVPGAPLVTSLAPELPPAPVVPRANTASVVMLSDGAQLAEIKRPTVPPAVTDRALVITQSPTPNLQCPFTVAINQTASTRLVVNPGGATRIHVCSFGAVSATAQSVSLVEGTGATCATGTTGLYGGTSASAAWAANGGVHGMSDRITIPMQKNGDDLCLLQSGAGNVSGTLTYGIY